jgi:lipopolysaccharide biosynthesis glycosyltransferase
MVVVLSADDRYAMPCAVTLASVLANHAGEISIYVLESGISDQNKRHIAEVAGARASLSFISVDERALQQLPKVTRLNPLPTAALFRLSIPELLPSSITRAIYLDCDMIVRGDLQEVWDADFKGQPLLAVQDSCKDMNGAIGLPHHRALGIPPDAPYFNSGLMVMDLPKWRAERLSGRVFDYLNHHNTRLLDQDALNAVLWNRWTALDQKWNHQHQAHDADGSLFHDESLDRARLIHFAVPIKPWVPFCFHPAKGEFFQALRSTPFSGWKLPELPAGEHTRMIGYYPVRFEALRSRDATFLEDRATILLQSEPGFDLIAIADHLRAASDRRNKPLVKWPQQTRDGTVLVENAERVPVAELRQADGARLILATERPAPRALLDFADARARLIPLRERKAKIPWLFAFYGGTARPMTDRHLLAAMQHDWPENFLELKTAARAKERRQVEGGSDEEIRRELWRLIDEAARQALTNSGVEPTALARLARSAEILCVHESIAREAYQAYGFL